MRRMGSALYLIKGTPMLAELRATDACFEEIAVTLSLGNATREVFAHPVSKILVEAGTHLPCSSLMPVLHYLHPVTSLDQDITDSEGLSGQWFSFNPHPTLHAPLERMSALIPLNHVFQDISAVAHGSLFQAKVLDDAIVGGHNNRALQSQVFIADSQGNVYPDHFLDDLDNLSKGAKDSLTKAIFPNLHNLFGKFATYTVLIIVVILCVCFFNQILEQILRLKTSFNSIGCNLGIFKSFFPELHRQTHPATILPLETQQIISALQLKQKSMEHQLRIMLQRLDNQDSPKLQQLIPFNGRNRALNDVAETIPFLQFNPESGVVSLNRS